MDIGVSTACLYPLETEKALYELAERGVKNVEIFVNSIDELEGQVLVELRRIIGEYGMNVLSMHPFSSPMETLFLFGDYPRRTEYLIDIYKRYFEVMAEIGAGVFVLHGAILSSKVPDERYMERYLRLFRLAKEFGVTVAQENICYCKSSSVRFIEDMIGQLGDEVRFVVDLKQARRSNVDPNTIEMLGCKPEHYFYISDIGREMIANRKMFLSKRAVHSFGGYANQQLRRLENALARDRLSQARREEHILNSMKGAVKSFESRYTIFENGSIVLYTDESPREDLDREIFADIQLKKYPVREFNSVINDLTNVIGTYEKLNHRNHKKDDEHLNKHAMHLIRLYLLCLDILEKEDIVTYRGDDMPLLMSIRKGDYQLEDGTYRPEFFEMVSDFEKRLNYAKQNTSLPDNPDMKKVEEFVMSVNRRAIDA